MRKSILLLYAFLTLACQAQTDEWYNASKNAVNRQPMHTSYFAYESQQKAYFLSTTRSRTIPFTFLLAFVPGLII